MCHRRAVWIAVAIGIVLTATSPVGAATIFHATLTGAQEVPPNASLATGLASLLLNTPMTALTYSVTVQGIDFTGLQTASPTDNLAAAHIHAAPFGVNGPIVFGFFGAPLNDTNPNDVVVTPFGTGVGGTITGKWDLPEGNNTTLAAQLGNLLAGNTYLNFHTTGFPGGEIRGQIVVPAPATLLLLASGLVGVGAIACRRGRRRETGV